MNITRKNPGPLGGVDDSGVVGKFSKWEADYTVLEKENIQIWLKLQRQEIPKKFQCWV